MMKNVLITLIARCRHALLSATGYSAVPALCRVGLSLLVLLTGVSTLASAQTLSASLPFPQFNSSYISGTNITIQATATTPASTTITKVEFFYDAAFSGTYTKIGEDLTAPYSVTWTAPSVPTSRSYQIKAVVTNSASNTAVANAPTNYIGITVYAANYVSTRNWYVSAVASSTNTAGTEASPFNTIQKAADRVAPGDTVFVMAGTYTSTSSDIVSIRRTGTPTRSIVFMPYKTDKPVLAMGNANWQSLDVLPAAAYLKIQGFEIIGNNANVTLTQAQAQPGACEGPNPTATPTAKFNGNGISIDGRNGTINRPHHITIAGNTIHDCGGGGVSAIQSDYITVENNTIYNTSWYTVYGTSGISIFNSWNYDNTTDVKMIVRRNRSYGNMLKIAWNIGGTGTNCKFYDGNGIILDNNRANDPTKPSVVKNALGDYTGKILLENNLCYKNGGRGININYSDNAIVVNNTTYQNGQSDGPFGVGIDNELIMQGSIGARIYNNIFYGKPGELPSSVSGSSDIMQNNNLTFSDFNNGYFTDNQNIVGKDPQFVDPAAGDFRLASTSPAINAGSATPGQYATKDFPGTDRPQGAGVDIGAYEFQGTPLNITQQPVSGSAVYAGTPVSVSVVVAGLVQTYQWYKDGTALTGIASATTATLSLSAVAAADQGNYTVVATGFTSVTSTAFALTLTAPPTTGPATLTVTSFTCYTTAAGLSSVNFVVGYSNGTFAPALPDLFINGVTASGQLGQAYTVSFDANQSTLPIADNATRSTYFVWDFRQACTGPAAPPVPTGPATLTVTSVTCVSTNSVLSSVNFVLGYSNGTFVPALSPLFINGVTASGQLGQVYTLSFDGNQSLLPIADDATRSTYFVWNFRQACTTGAARFAAETDVPWLVAVQGNPTRDDVAVVVTNAQGQSLYLELVDMTGQIVAARKIVPVLGQHREVFDLSRQGTGLLLLRTTGATRTQTLKVLRN